MCIAKAFTNRGTQKLLTMVCLLGCASRGLPQRQAELMLISSSSTRTIPVNHTAPSDTRAEAVQPRPRPHNHSDLNEQIRSNLQSVFRGDLILRGADLEASVDDQTITLTGTVQNYRQHQRALELLSPYINERSVEDKVLLE
jgi:hypothetical protein